MGMALVYVSLAFVAGTWFGSHLPVPWSVALPIAAVALAGAVLLRRRRLLLLGGLCVVLLLCGALRFGAVPAGDDLESYVGQGTVEVVGLVVDEPEPGDSSLGLVVAVRELDGEEMGGTVVVRTARYPGYGYGDLLRLTGELEAPPQDLDGFDYRAYLASQGIYSLMYYPAIEVMATGQGPEPLQWVSSLRHRMGEALAASLAEPEASLAQGVLLGLRQGIPASLYEDFRRSGTAHILAISGLHMAIVAGMVLSFSVWLFGRHRPTYFLLTLVILWTYALLAGMSPSVLRAAIMASIFLLGTFLGRQRSAITALAFAAAIMVAASPRILWSVSFQLSFAAVAGVIVLTPRLQEWGQRTRAPNVVVDSFSFSLGAVIATLPLIGYYFGYVSLVGLPATFLVLFALPGVIVLSALAGLVGLFTLPVAQAIGWVDWLLLKYMVSILHGFAALPYSSLEVGGMDVGWAWLYYGALGGWH